MVRSREVEPTHEKLKREFRQSTVRVEQFRWHVDLNNERGPVWFGTGTFI